MTDPYPKWARWIAQDEDGEIWVYEYEPDPRGNMWMRFTGRWLKISIGPFNPHWRHSLDYLG